jgi:preprotein translocase subunit SecF
MQFLKKIPEIDFMSKALPAGILSLLVIATGVVFYFINGGFNYGVDFKGGTMMRIAFTGAVTDQQIRDTLSSGGFGDATVQAVKGTGEFFVRLGLSTQETTGIGDQVIDALGKGIPGSGPKMNEITVIGPKIGAETRGKAVWASVLAIGLILLYVTFRFQLAFAVGAIIALIHDAFVTIAAFTITNTEISLTFVAAVLTIIGFSINDTIVIYDRIRENQQIKKGMSLRQLINLSINQTLSRTILTTGTVFMTILALFFLAGPGTIHDFSFAMLIGSIAGSYSTIFIAATVVVLWKPTMKARPAASARKR